MKREEDKRLKELRDNGFTLYSISKLNTMAQCPYQAYLNYVLHEKQTSNVWAELGSAIHDALQKCVDEQIQDNTKLIVKAIKEELENLDISGTDFPNDRNGNPTIRENWIANMMRFAKEFKTPKPPKDGKFETEQLCVLKINDHAAMHGYIDLMRYDKDGTLHIIDWKTSSKFDKEHLLQAGRQLIFYALAKRADGLEVNRVSWVMLKYCVTSWTLKNGKTKEKVSEWRNYIKDLQNVLEKKLAEAGYDEFDIECYMRDALKDNSMDKLPEEVRSQFKTKVQVRDYEITDELIEETMNYIHQQITLFEEKGSEEKNYEHCNIEENSFFCHSLCGYSKKCPHYHDYCEQFTKEDSDEDDLF